MDIEGESLLNITVNSRKKQFDKFIKVFSDEFYSKNKRGDYIYENEVDMFKKRKISSGVEGVVYRGYFKKHDKFGDYIIIKVTNLYKLQETKDVKKYIIKMTPEKLYKLFLTSKVFKEPSLIELLSQTLTNQLVLQKICPNYALNYYWEYEESKNLNSYNEYINGGDFHDWAKEPHSDEEWYNALFQIMVGLYALKKYFNMIHADFHTRNILVYKVKSGGYWKYKINGNTYYLPNLGYIFLINDFGFAWVPGRIYMNWYYKSRLKYITKSGMHFYDLSVFLQSIIKSNEYKLPHSFKKNIKNMFKKEEVVYTITKNYYKLYYEEGNPRLEKYPNINVNYKGVNTNLGDKLYEIFYNGNFYNLSKRINDSKVIETYSLDKKFNKKKLSKIYRDLVIN